MCLWVGWVGALAECSKEDWGWLLLHAAGWKASRGQRPQVSYTSILLLLLQGAEEFRKVRQERLAAGPGRQQAQPGAKRQRGVAFGTGGRGRAAGGEVLE